MAKLTAYIIFCFIYLFSLLPLRVHYVISDFMAWFLRCVAGYRKSTIFTNLARSFPELRYGELEKLAKEYYEYMCDIIVESVWQLSSSEKRCLEMVRSESAGVMDKLMASHSRVIVLMGHRGNWEMAGAMCNRKSERTQESFSSYPIYFGYKAAENKVANELFILLRRVSYRKWGNPGTIVESKRILHDLAKSGDEKCTYVFIADQSPLLARVVTKFLNQPTLMFQGAEFMARRYDIPVVYMDMARTGRGKYMLTYSLISENPAGTERGWITRTYAKMLEEHIDANRHNWLWSHKRWKREFTGKEVAEYRMLYSSSPSDNR